MCRQKRWPLGLLCMCVCACVCVHACMHVHVHVHVHVQGTDKKKLTLGWLCMIIFVTIDNILPNYLHQQLHFRLKTFAIISAGYLNSHGEFPKKL